MNVALASALAKTIIDELYTVVLLQGTEDDLQEAEQIVFDILIKEPVCAPSPEE